MKWILPGLWLSAVLFMHIRGRIRLPLHRQLLDHSALLAPLNALMLLRSAVPTTPYLDSHALPELEPLRANWRVVREEALAMAARHQIKAAGKHDDIGFNSFFKYGWKRFYLKWYDARHPSAERLCPRTVALLQQIPQVKAAMFAELPPGGQLNPHRDPYAGSLRYHLGLATPNDEHCYICVDGLPYSWRDGQDVLFDETYVHHARNESQANRIILFCDIERPMRDRWSRALNRWFGRAVMSQASSPNDNQDQTGAINRLTHLHWQIDQKRRAFKHWNRPLYRLSKYSLIGLVVLAYALA